MIIQHSIKKIPPLGNSWEELWQGADAGLICSWLRGITKASESEPLRLAAQRGELPELPWKGGGKAIKGGLRIGSLHYLAMWQGLRGDDLCVDLSGGQQITCTLTNMSVTFTNDATKLGASEA